MFNNLLPRLLFCLSIFIVFSSQAKISLTETATLSSAILEEDISLQIRLPSSYHHSKSFKYPVIYVLDGNSHFSHVYGNIDFLSSFAIVPEFIVVGITSNDRLLNFTPTETSAAQGRSGGAEDYVLFFKKELMPFIKQQYRASNYEVLSGHSMAGLFSAYMMISQKTLFDAHFSISPSLWWDDEWLVKYSDRTLKKKNQMQGYWFLNMASEPNKMKNAFEHQLSVLNKQAPKSMRWQSQWLPNETHDSTPLVSHINALNDLFKGWNAIPQVDVMPLDDIHKHYKKLNQRYRHEFALNEQQYNVYGNKALGENKLNMAIDILSAGIQAFPKADALYDSLSEAYERQGDMKKALELQQQAVALATQNESEWQAYMKQRLRKLRLAAIRLKQ